MVSPQIQTLAATWRRQENKSRALNRYGGIHLTESGFEVLELTHDLSLSSTQLNLG